MTPRTVLSVATVLVAALLLTACTGSSDPSNQEDAMYCDLIDPTTLEPIVGDSTIKDFGGPVPKNGDRMVTCNLYAPDEDRDVLSVFEFELGTEARAEDERAKTTAAMSKHAQEDPEHYVALASDGDDLGYAWHTGDTAAAQLLTAERSITVTAPADAEQAGTFTPLLLKVAQEIDANLDAWDAQNSSD